MIVAEMSLRTLQQEVTSLASLHAEGPEEASLAGFLYGAITALAWVGGAETHPVTLALAMKQNGVQQ